jgi:hypothetical protein
MKARSSPPSAALIPVGEPWRLGLRRPVFGSLLLASLFFFYTAPVKETPFLFDHAPWLNDPFDTVISFMMFFVPLIGLFCVPRVLLCRRSDPLSAARIGDVLRGCRVVLAGISLTLLAQWIAVAIRENRGQWNEATWLQIGLLAAMSAASLAVIGELRRVGLPRGAGRHGPAGPDWVADFFLFARKQGHLLGPVKTPAEALLGWGERGLAGTARRHPLWAALGACAAFGAAVGINQGLREDYFPSATVMACVLLTVGMFGLLAASGFYLGLIRSSTPLHGTRRRLADAAVITCAGILVPFAVRNDLWWVIGSNQAGARLPQLVQLLGIFTVVIFVAAYGAESLLRLHTPNPPQPGTETHRRPLAQIRGPATPRGLIGLTLRFKVV